MSKEIVVLIGFDYYCIGAEDFAELTEISKCSAKVRQKNFTGKWERDPENEGKCFIRDVSFVDCDLTPVPEPEPAPDERPQGAVPRVPLSRDPDLEEPQF